MRLRPPVWVALAAVALLAVLVLAGCGGGDDEDGGDTTAPTTPIPEEGEGVVLGYNEAITADTAAEPLFEQSGATFIRVALSWATVEPTEGGARNFAVYDAIDDALLSVGMRPLWVVTNAPCWAASTTCAQQSPGLAPDEAHLADYADFTAEVAERYPDAVGLEIWNEPNIPNFWRPLPDAGLYRSLLSATADAVHETGSEVPVAFSGPSPTTPEQVAEDPEKIGFADFIRQVMGGADAPDVDAIALHPYSLLQRGDPIEESIALYEEGRDVAEEVAPGVPIWVTEVGLTTAGQYAIPPEEQAAGLEAIVGTIADDGVPLISIHRFFDQADPPLQFERGFGVVEADRVTPKPSFCSAADAVGAECSP